MNDQFNYRISKEAIRMMWIETNKQTNKQGV